VGAAAHESRRGADGARRDRVRDVLAVGHHDERRAGAERGGEAGGDQEVGEDDVRPRRAAHVAQQLQVALAPGAPPVDHRAVDGVAAAFELLDDRHEEGSVVRVIGSGPELRDEEDAHGAAAPTA
jgi:hypothetical protein